MESRPQPVLARFLRKWIFKPIQGVNIVVTARSLAAVNVLQLAAIVTLLVWIITGNANITEWMLIALCLVVILSNLILTHTSRTTMHYKLQVREMENLMAAQEDLNRQLRMQRHDFINHIQVIFALLQMDESDQAQAYLMEVYKGLEQVGRHMRTSSLAVNALLAAKSVQGEGQGLRVVLDINTALEHIPMKDWEFCRILSNLMDNAMDAAQMAVHGLVTLKIWEDIHGIGFSVTNNGPPIAPEHGERIFQPGFTTKGERGTGMGLYIVRTLVNEHRGTLDMESNPQATCFTVHLPLLPLLTPSNDNLE